MLDYEVKCTSDKWHHPAVLGIGRNISSTRNDFKKNLQHFKEDRKLEKVKKLQQKNSKNKQVMRKIVMCEVSNDTVGGSSVKLKCTIPLSANNHLNVFCFDRVVKLWNSLPEMDLTLSQKSIKKIRKLTFISFSSKFKSRFYLLLELPVSIHFVLLIQHSNFTSLQIV